uniref:Uncharacterized protein n=1 Tax=Glossina pallidipes TaxID=7398 RepID=A0A1A9ZWQ7_GLOPL
MNYFEECKSSDNHFCFAEKENSPYVHLYALPKSEGNSIVLNKNLQNLEIDLLAYMQNEIIVQLDQNQTLPLIINQVCIRNTKEEEKIKPNITIYKVHCPNHSNRQCHGYIRITAHSDIVQSTRFRVDSGSSRNGKTSTTHIWQINRYVKRVSDNYRCQLQYNANQRQCIKRWYQAHYKHRHQ